MCGVRFSDLTPPGKHGPPMAMRVIAVASVARDLHLRGAHRPQARLERGRAARHARDRPDGGRASSLALRRHEWWPGARFTGLCSIGVAVLLFAAFQPDSAGYVGVYFVVVLAGLRLDREAAALVCLTTVGGLVADLRVRGRGRRADRRPAVQPRAVVLRHAPRAPARRHRRRAAPVPHRARGVGGAGRARPGRPRAARRARALTVRAGAAARRGAAAGAEPGHGPGGGREPAARAPPGHERARGGAPGDQRPARRRPARDRGPRREASRARR